MAKATKTITEIADTKMAVSGGAFMRPNELGFLASLGRTPCRSIASGMPLAAWSSLKTKNDAITKFDREAIKLLRDLCHRSVNTAALGWGLFVRRGGFSLLGIALVLGTPVAALAAPNPPEPDYSTIGALLLAFFGVVVLFESGFGLLFQWRLFREFLPVAGWRAPIMFVVSAVLTYSFPALDVFHRAVSAFAGETVATPAGDWSATWLISAAILAGGSAGMMRIFEQLGIRSAPTEPAPPAIDQSKAWLSLRVTGPMKDLKAVLVKIEPVPDATAVHAGIAGTLRNEDFKTRFQRVMGRDLRRFPPSGGYLVEAGKPYKITLAYPPQVAIGGQAETRVLDVFSHVVDITKGPEAISFAPRAVVDLIVDLPGSVIVS